MPQANTIKNLDRQTDLEAVWAACRSVYPLSTELGVYPVKCDFLLFPFLMCVVCMYVSAHTCGRLVLMRAIMLRSVRRRLSNPAPTDKVGLSRQLALENAPPSSYSTL